MLFALVTNNLLYPINYVTAQNFGDVDFIETGIEEANMDEEDSEDENIENSEIWETVEWSAWDIKGLTWEVSEIGSWELENLIEETDEEVEDADEEVEDADEEAEEVDEEVEETDEEVEDADEEVEEVDEEAEEVDEEVEDADEEVEETKEDTEGKTAAIDELKNIVEWEIKSEEELTWNNLELSNAWEILNEEVIEKSEKYNDVSVNVKALEWSFPEWTYVEIEAVRWEYLDEVKQQLSDESDKVTEDSEMVAFDIKFLYKLTDWTIEELQPKKWELVQVTFDYSDNEELKSVDENENKELEVYHINDKDENWEKVQQWEEKVEKIEVNQEESKKVEDAVVIDAEKFSVYVLTLVKSWEETGIVLTLDSNDWNFVENENITVNEWIGTIISTWWYVILPWATKEGYNFAWWYSDESFQSKLWWSGDSINIPENTTWYARWTRTITYANLFLHTHHH